MVQSLLLMIFPLAMAFAAANDLFSMRIPNKISILLVGAFAVLAAVIGMPLWQVATHVGISLVVLLITFMLFSFGFLGGGDAKLMAAGALWMGDAHVLQFFFLLTFLGGVLAVAILAYRKFVPAALVDRLDWAARLHQKDSGIPYGIAIAAAGLVIYPATDFFRVLGG